MSYLYCVECWNDDHGSPHLFHRFVYRKCLETGKVHRQGAFAVSAFVGGSRWREMLHTPATPVIGGEGVLTSMEEVVEVLLNEWQKDRDAKVAMIDRDHEAVRTATLAAL